ncbi:MAG TPA: phosphotransferase [Nevskiaceae bacterium]
MAIGVTDEVSDARAKTARAWALQILGLPAARFSPASADASFRRYFRVATADASWVVMDAPPEHEDCRPFLKVGDLLRSAGLHAPQVYAEDLGAGFLLLEDLGPHTMLDVLDADNADRLYAAAMDALVQWQKASRPGVLPDYDEALLRRELGLFPQWFLGVHLGVTLDAAEQAAWTGLCDALVANAATQPRVYVHRDYMPRNLVPGEPLLGILDFQDAVFGPVAYDPICLFKDAFLSWPEPRVSGWLRSYRSRAQAAGVPVPAWPRFARDCDWIGLQRHLKVLGIFARLGHRDGKAKYAADTPRFVRYVMEVAPCYPELAPLVTLFERRVLPRYPSAA